MVQRTPLADNPTLKKCGSCLLIESVVRARTVAGLKKAGGRCSRFVATASLESVRFLLYDNVEVYVDVGRTR